MDNSSKQRARINLRISYGFTANVRFTALLLVSLWCLLVLDAQNVYHEPSLRSFVLLLIGVNLVSCMVKRRRFFSKHISLLGFHIGLLATGLAVSSSGFIYFDQYFEIAEEQDFYLLPEKARHGILSPPWLANTGLLLYGLDSSFWKGDKKKDTRAVAALLFEDKLVNNMEILPNRPAKYRGLKFYLAKQCGYSAYFTFINRQGRSESGFMNFPEYSKFPDQQEQELIVPGLDKKIRCRLVMEKYFNPDGEWTLKDGFEGSVILAIEGFNDLIKLNPRQPLVLAEGTLQLNRIKRWAGIQAKYDPTDTWVLWLSIFSGASLLVHYVVTWRKKPLNI